MRTVTYTVLIGQVDLRFSTLFWSFMLLPSHLQQEMTMAVYILFYAWLTRLCLFNSVLPFEKQNDIACRPELVITNSAQYFCLYWLVTVPVCWSAGHSLHVMSGSASLWVYSQFDHSSAQVQLGLIKSSHLSAVDIFSLADVCLSSVTNVESRQKRVFITDSLLIGTS